MHSNAGKEKFSLAVRRTWAHDWSEWWWNKRNGQNSKQLSKPHIGTKI